MLAIGRLLRLSLAPSAAADVAVGAVVAAGAWPAGAAPFLLIGASLGLYHGGMALNDWADRREDARARPERPIPSGAVPARLALALGLGLPALGVLLAWRASPACGPLALALAGLVLAYDLGPRGPLAGPLLLGLLRAGNLALGMRLGSALATPGAAGLGPLALGAAAAGYGLYVLVVSRLGRLEDRAEPPAPGVARRLLGGAALVLVLLAPAVLALEALTGGAERRHLLGGAAALALALLAARALARAAREDPATAGELVRAMGLALRRLLVATSSLALASATPAGFSVALLVLAGYPVSHGLRRVFPPS